MGANLIIFKPQFVKGIPPSDPHSTRRRAQPVESKRELEAVGKKHGLNTHWL